MIGEQPKTKLLVLTTEPLDSPVTQANVADSDLAILADGKSYVVIKDRFGLGELTGPEMACLVHLSAHEVATGGELAVVAGVRANAIGARLAALRRRGLVRSFYSVRYRTKLWQLV